MEKTTEHSTRKREPHGDQENQQQLKPARKTWATPSRVAFHSEQVVNDLSLAPAATIAEQELAGTPFKPGTQSSPLAPCHTPHCQVLRADEESTATGDSFRLESRLEGVLQRGWSWLMRSEVRVLRVPSPNSPSS